MLEVSTAVQLMKNITRKGKKQKYYLHPFSAYSYIYIATAIEHSLGHM
jgi:hypothetical protein